MASFMDNLRRMVGFKPKGGEETPKKEKTDRQPGAFNELSRRFLACEDEAQKKDIWDQMCKVLPDTLFLAAMLYEGEDPGAPVRDRDLHASVGSKALYALNESIVTNGNPGYRMAKRRDPRRIHLLTLVQRKSKEEWVALFTDFTKLLPVFGQKYHITMISFNEARQIAKPYKGMIINPGSDAIKLDMSMLKQIK
ncbi:MAG: SseB family protein [Clostridia bacterium]|nr:SseB family protein [Clostridia bacterium]